MQTVEVAGESLAGKWQTRKILHVCRRGKPGEAICLGTKFSFLLSRSSGDTGARAHEYVNATDIGGRGCYVETLLPLPLSAQGTITFGMDAIEAQTTAVVRASDPGVGMGIEFTTLDTHVQERLQQFLDKMDALPPQRIPSEH